MRLRIYVQIFKWWKPCVYARNVNFTDIPSIEDAWHKLSQLIPHWDETLSYEVE